MPNARDERNRILDMLAEGKITADQAAEILKAIGTSEPPAAPPPPRPPRTPYLGAGFESDGGRAYVVPKQGIARMLRISIDADSDDSSERAKIRVNVPLALARFAMKFMPEEARVQLDDKGIDLNELLDTLGDELPEGRLVDIDATDRGGGKGTKIIVEVV
jgi:hypothetical protein